MNDGTLKIGYAGLSKASWKTPKIEGVMNDALRSLGRIDARIVHPGNLVCSEDEAIAAAGLFNAEGVDAIVMHFATFPVGAMIPALARRVHAPIILFANPEEPAEGGIWEQNSFCGANMAAFVMRKLNKAVRFAWGKAQEADKALAKALRVVAAERTLRDARLGLVGGRVPGFYTSNIDELKLREKFGSAIEMIDLLEVVELAKSLDAKEAKKGLEIVKRSSKGVCAVSEKELELGGRLLSALLKTVEKYKLTGLGVRCWPEFSDLFGIAPCAVLGMLNDAGIPTSCEGDMPGAVSMLIQKALSDGGTPVFMDFISFDEKDNTGVVWHCGAAPSKLCRSFEETVLRKHMRVDGGDKKGLTNDFSLKAGRVSVCKLDETGSGYRMLIFTGTALDTDKFIRGNPLRIKFDSPVRGIVDGIMKKGFEHHYAVVHADIKAELIEFCDCNGIEPVVL